MNSLKTFFISDLHLSQNTPHVWALFQHFIEHHFTPGDQLFILGDFFEYYLGPDLLDPVQLQALNTLKHLTEQGSIIYFMRGNRDFLINAKTLAQYQITLLPDPTSITLNGQSILLSHGDILCTEDIKYQRYRRLAHLGTVQWLFLHLPRALRLKIANGLHNQNPHKTAIQDPNYSLADATPEAIEKMLTHYQPEILIYGHVHKIGKYQHGQTTRLVLGDWYTTGNYLELSTAGIKAEIFSLSTT